MPRFSRRTTLAGLAALATSPLAALPAQATGTATAAAGGDTAFRPKRTVRLISPLLAGGATDAIIRPIAARLGERWGQTVVVDNRPGGGTIIGTQAVVQAPPDGHTFGVVISAFTVNPGLHDNLPYDTFTDVTPITQIGVVSGALVAHPEFPVRTIDELVALAKTRPGQISYASLGVGTAAHITAELLKVRKGIDLIHVPYSGSSAAYRDLLPGRVPLGFVVLESALPHIQAGKLRLVCLTDARRNRLYPDVPVIEESVPGLGYESVFGLIGPRGLAPALTRALNADIVAVLREPEIRARLLQQSMTVVASSPAEFAALIRRDVGYWKKAVKESGAHV